MTLTDEPRPVVYPAGDDPSLAQLLDRLSIVEAIVRTAVLRRRDADPDPDDRFRGLYLSAGRVDSLLARGAPLSWSHDPHVSSLLAGVEATADEAEGRGNTLRLRRLAGSAGLSPVDVDLLLVALAPDVDPRFEQFYGYLNDDVTRRRASVALALELAGASLASASARSRLSAGAPLVDQRLVIVEDPERPFLSRSLRVPDRVAAHLLGGDVADAAIRRLVLEDCPPMGDGCPLPAAWEAGVQLVYVRQRGQSAARGFAAAAAGRLGRPLIHADLGALAIGDDAPEVARLLVREACLAGGLLVAGPLEPLVERSPAAVEVFAEGATTVVVFGQRGWDPSWSRAVPLIIEAPPVTEAERSRLWHAAFETSGVDGFDPAEAMASFRLRPEQVGRAADAAKVLARLAGTAVTPELLRSGARAQNAAGLEGLARRIEPGVGWDDLVLPEATIRQLRDLAGRAWHRNRVLDYWRMRPGGGRGRSVTALFAGDSGTGKTLSAEVVAGDLGVDLYVVDLATVVDKYIGETEKNLDRIFSEADHVNGLLLFDEADALFGKRSDVRDARDRYANVEVAYLLQRMESFNGLAILTTNLRSNLDEAFARRLDLIVDFPVPDVNDRRRLWDVCLGPNVPRGEDLDFDFCARAFELTGGHIRSVAVTAAYLAAASDGRVGMAQLMRATHREYRKLGRLCVAAEFGPYIHLAMS